MEKIVKESIDLITPELATFLIKLSSDELTQTRVSTAIAIADSHITCDWWWSRVSRMLYLSGRRQRRVCWLHWGERESLVLRSWMLCWANFLLGLFLTSLLYKRLERLQQRMVLTFLYIAESNCLDCWCFCLIVAFGVVPRLKDVISRMLPVLASVKHDNLRWAFCSSESAAYEYWC